MIPEEITERFLIQLCDAYTVFIRRCGKSVLLEQYQQRLLANGVTPEQIISINFENLDYEPLKDYMKLYNYLKERLCAELIR